MCRSNAPILMRFNLPRRNHREPRSEVRRVNHLPSWVFVFFVAIAAIMTGCVSPGPRSFVDVGTLPANFVGREHRAFAEKERLVIEVVQVPGFNVTGFETFQQDGALYVSPQRISSGGGGTAQFEIDVSKYQLGADWPLHVYWLLESYAYPIGNSGLWSGGKRSPWPRRKMEISTR